MSIIYKITNIKNGKLYIGKTLKSINERFNEHIRDSRKNRNEIRPLYRAINKYGAESFKIEFIEEVDDNISSEREIFWINHYDTFKKGYNATKGGDGKLYVDREEIITLYKNNKSIKDTSNITGVSDRTIRTILKDNNIERLSPSDVRKRQYQKHVLQFDKDNNFIKEFESATDASIELIGNKSGHSNIANCCRGKNKTAYGFIWKFKD